MRSLRRTLAVRFALTMLAALAVVGGWIYLGLEHDLLAQLDRALRGSALGVTPTSAGPASRERFLSDGAHVIVLRDSAGRVVALNTPLGADLPLDPDGFQRARHGEAAFATHRGAGVPVRSMYAPLAPGAGGGAVVVQVAASLGPVQLASRTMLWRLLATVLVGAGVTMIGAGWLAKSSVAPVAEIAAQARAISGGETGERITLHADVVEFSDLTGVLNQMLARLDRANAWPRQIIRDLGHDLRTPITVMRAETEVALLSQRTPEGYRRVLETLLEELDRVTLIADALVLLGRLESGQLTLDLEAVDAGLLVREAVARREQHHERHVISASASGGPVVHADRRLLASALDQLLDNAVRYTPPGSRIEASAAAIGAIAELVVEDDGPGVAPEVVPHLFERFFRADAARGRAAGPGLGLTVVRAVVERHGGTVQAEPGAAGGLRVRIRLPQHHPAAR